MQHLTIVFSFVLVALAAGENVVNTYYWDPSYPFQQATCAQIQNESLIVAQYRTATTCKDGGDMPWIQAADPKSRLYFCSDDGELYYKECAPFEYNIVPVVPLCSINCSAPIKSLTPYECYHGTRLNVISCESSAPTLTGTYYQKPNVDGTPDSSYIYGAQACEDAFGPYLSTFGCNSTHYWTVGGCQYACKNCTNIGVAKPLNNGDVCLNSKELQCYSGYKQDSNFVVPLVTKTVNSNVVCAKFDYFCRNGDCSCTANQQATRACKHGYAFMPQSECLALKNVSLTYFSSCCNTNGCNAPVPGSIPCISATPPPFVLYDDAVSPAFNAVFSSSTGQTSSIFYSGIKSIQFSVISRTGTPNVRFNCVKPGCYSNYRYLTFMIKSSSGSSGSLDVYQVKGTQNYNVYSNYYFPQNQWLLFTVNLMADANDGIWFQVVGSLNAVVNIDQIVLSY